MAAIPFVSSTEDVERDCSNPRKDFRKYIDQKSALVLPSSTLTSVTGGLLSQKMCPGTSSSVTEVGNFSCVQTPAELYQFSNPKVPSSTSLDHCERMMSGIPDRPGQRRDLSQYSHRLDTFQDGPHPWPRATPTAQYLAQLGFYFTGIEQEVRCFLCNVVISEWDDGKDPLIKHHSKSPNCSFIHQRFPLQLKTLFLEEKVEHRSPHYSSSSFRLHSFSNWQYTSIVTSYQLASAGFFYTGYGSRVECFSCGLIHEQWKKGDLPLHVHRQQSPSCPFITSLLSKDCQKPLDSTATQLPPTPSDYPASRVPDYANLTVRIRSFKHLARTFPIAAEACAEAGLFFLRKPDVMKCFSCGAIVRDWVDGDIPAEKHREANSSCKFLHEFFPTKFSEDVELSTLPKLEGVDPNTLPEPEFDEEDLERMRKDNESKSKLDPSYQQMTTELAKVSLNSPVSPATHQALIMPVGYVYTNSITSYILPF